MTDEANMNITILDDVDVELVHWMGTDDDILQAMLVSTRGANDVHDMTAEAKAGRINYLMRDHHGSPFEQAVIKVYVKAPIFVFREWHRHRIASYNEMSGRYKVLPGNFYIPSADRPLVQIGKPGHYQYVAGEPLVQEAMRNEMMTAASEDWARYNRFLAAGIAKEVARIYLPVAIYSEMYCTMNLRALMNFLSLRTHNEDATFVSNPQYEISLGADKLEAIFQSLFPMVWKAWNDNGRVAP